MTIRLTLSTDPSSEAEGESVLVKAPGRLTISRRDDERTIALTGRNLLFPDMPYVVETMRAAGLPDIGLITGRVGVTESFDSESGTITQHRESQSQRVLHVCEVFGE